ncbi:MAG TPA: ABC transporter substrate-binding protein [Solirubrobacterales bacterium]|jgi:branched-chain amino acid transport system substrate-binding protein
MVLLVLAMSVALAACGGSSSSSESTEAAESSKAGGGEESSGGKEAASTEPIRIGAAIDESSFMSSVDDPALAGAELQARKINEAGGVDGREIEFTVGNTAAEPGKNKSVAEEQVSNGAEILWVTCDVDVATPAIQVGLAKKMLTVSPCIGTDQMGPKRFGSEGKLAFSFGNVAQDEGAAMAEAAKNQGWKTANMAVDQSIAYEPNVCEAFKVRFEENGGEVKLEEKFTEGDGTIGSVANKINGSEAEFNVLCATVAGDATTFVSSLRGAGNETPILTPWSLDGTFWLPKNPKEATNVWTVTGASVYGDDPNPEVNKIVKELTAEGKAPVTSAFLLGAGAVDGIKAAIEENEGSTEGEALATSMEGFKNLETVSGSVSFSPELHTAFGREYRLIEVTDGKAKFVETVEAGTPAEISG